MADSYSGTGMAAFIGEFAAAHPNLFTAALNACGLRASFGRLSVHILHGERIVAHFFPKDDIAYIIDDDATARMFEEMQSILERIDYGALADDENGEWG